ncbi:hypothetical protein AXY43_20185 [Clostridium sp. MF28]|uniref:O-antigen ligase family protein n=1 Tax=Clostridium TaxID=1485 RepID=UPI000CF8FBFA|nr:MULTISPECIES: O-antigen ligase family protein [Clostridium]AVK50121.1 hypothetical protein AXY43_20185 [Clostridium sp. MF28]PSM57643.1 hypothetical protein C4L39_11690 [Clostridium diolis]
MKISLKKSLFLDYCFWGIILSLYITLTNIWIKFFVLIIFTLVYMVLSGFNRNINRVISFIKRNYKQFIIFVFFLFVSIANTRNKTDALSTTFYLLAFGLMIVSGYLYARNVDLLNNSKPLLRLTWVILLTAIFGIWTNISGRNVVSENFSIATQSVTRVNSVFASPLPCSLFFTIGLSLSLVLIKYIAIRYLLALVFLYGIFLTQSRSSWIILTICMVIVLVRYIVDKKKSISKRKFMSYGAVSLLLVIAAIYFRGQISDIYSSIQERMFGESISNDMSYTWRFMTIHLLLSIQTPLNFHTYIGNGFNSAASLIQSMNFGSEFSYNVATTDNIYFSVFYDFGIFSVIMLGAILITSVKDAIKATSDVEKVVNYTLIIVLLFGFFMETIYWPSVLFVFATFWGIKKYVKENNKISNLGAKT